MRLLTAAILLSAVFRQATATPEVLSDTVTSGAAEYMVYHLRVALPEKADRVFSLEWQQPGDSLRCFARVRTCERDLPEGWDPEASVTIGHRCGDTETIDREDIIIVNRAFHNDGYSLRLSAGPGGCILEWGNTRADGSAVVPFPADGPVRITASADTDARPVRNDLRGRFMTPRRRAPFESERQLYDHLRASRDPREGLWQLFDSDTEPKKARVGGNYVLATANAGDGEFVIIYISGAENGNWQPLDIKGRFSRGIYDASYVMEWIDADGRLLDRGTGLNFEGDLLSLFFPYNGARMRLGRIPVPQNDD